MEERPQATQMLKKTPEGQFVKLITFQTIKDDWSTYRMDDLEVRVRMVATSMGKLFKDSEGRVPHTNDDGSPGVSVSGKFMIVAQEIADPSTEDKSE